MGSLFVTVCLAQTKVADVNTKISKSSYAEKIYLQLSNTMFTTGETIWFKAIVTNSLNKPSSISGVLYVDLIDFDKNILETKTLKLENGLSDGFFKLSNTLASGRYLVRAYTTWNRNFGQDFIYEQYIDILDLETINNRDVIRKITITETKENLIRLSASVFPEEIKDEYKKDIIVYVYSEGLLDSVQIKRNNKEYLFNYQLPKDLVSVKLKIKLEDIKLKNRKRKAINTYSRTIALNQEFLDLQFFPEGGQMIGGFINKIAYKSINYKGLGEYVQGQIVDEADSAAGSFSTNKLGMGYTFFKPSIGESYYGKIIEQDVIYKYPLPEVLPEGYMLSVMETQDFFRLIIKSNVKNSGRLYFQIKSRGVLIKEHTFKLKGGEHEVFINKMDLPHGISSVRLFDEDESPRCERLFFNLNTKRVLNISAETDNTFYAQRDKTTLNVAVSNKNNKPVEANFSVLVIDKNKLNSHQKLQPNILACFLLNSELKGFIENPNYYFSSADTTRKRDLEALMLTQGWRQYVYNSPDKQTDFEYQPEVNVSIPGRVGAVFNENKIPKKPVNLTMITKPSFGTQTRVTDSLGKFTFNLNNYFADNLDVIIQATNKKGLPKNYNIRLDPPLDPPKVSFQAKETMLSGKKVYKDFVEHRITEYETNKDFKLSSEHVALDAVELTGYNLTPEREKILKLHGPPDVVIENEALEKEEEDWMSGLYALLLAKFPDDIAFKSVKYMEDLIGIPPDTLGMGFERASTFEAAHVVNADFTLVYIDGEVVSGLEYEFLPYLPVRSVKSVEILRRPKGMFVDYLREAYPRLNPFERDSAANMSNIAVLSIYTFGSNGISALMPTKGIYKGRVSGLSVKKEFYAPKYAVLKPEDWDIPDLRALLHWEPSLYTNQRGKAQIEFYNDDSIGDKLIIIETITPDGKIGYSETTYGIEEKNENYR
ncbi:hypothetical protein [Cognatitamlana onchidii]|uniref:hypothetical protein n=1 Tax=Cognatitamlana onchidii TaxID=2562860 RepID=UPI0010A651D8|nr:hypothetical protein [Algibacter onchidii]